MALTPQQTAAILAAAQPAAAEGDPPAPGATALDTQYDKENVSELDGNFISASVELRTLVNTYGSPDLPTVFVVPTQENPSFAGLSIRQSDRAEVFSFEAILLIGDVMNHDSFLLHEVGHLAGLAHVDDATRVMDGYYPDEGAEKQLLDTERAAYGEFGAQFAQRDQQWRRR